MMQQQLKERLIGATVIVAIVVIFVPMILTGPIDQDPIMQTNIPERPTDNNYSRLMPLTQLQQIPNQSNQATKPELAETKDSVEIAITAVATDPITALEPEKIILSLKVEPNLSTLSEQKSSIAIPVQDQKNKQIGLTAWVVQLGSFSSKINADKLNVNLKKAGFAAFVDPLTKNGKTSYRVRIGPEILRADADRLLQDVKTKMKLKGIIVNYP